MQGSLVWDVNKKIGMKIARKKKQKRALKDEKKKKALSWKKKKACGEALTCKREDKGISRYQTSNNH